jgi:hypothetical protein
MGGVIMEDRQITYLKSWKNELENEINTIQGQYDGIRNEMLELRTKKSILNNIILTHGESPTIEDFKIESGYYTVVNRLKELESKFIELEGKYTKQINFNKTIVAEINRSLL